MSKALVVVPTYNELENIERLLRNIISLQQEFDVLVVDDNSPDGTSSIVKSLMKDVPGRFFFIGKVREIRIGLCLYSRL
jgi:dolichol-phosphate mannosyltransferase